jgi:hypothetical protein
VALHEVLVSLVAARAAAAVHVEVADADSLIRRNVKKLKTTLTIKQLQRL